MAQALLLKEMQSIGLRRALVASAGLSALVGQPPHDFARRLILANTGLDISGYRARQLNRSLIRWADLVLVMEESHRETIHGIDMSSRGKVYRVCEWSNVDVPDPYGRTEKEFEDTYRLLKRGVTEWSLSLVERIAT